MTVGRYTVMHSVTCTITMMHRHSILLTIQLKKMNTTYITVIAILFFTFIACTPKLANQQPLPVNVTATDKKGNLILLGKTNRERLVQAPFDTWYTKNYDSYVG